MKVNTQLLSKNVGQQIINTDNINILDLDREEIINLFKSYGFLLFRGFENSVDTFTQFTNSLSKDFLDYTGGVFNRRVINGNATILSVNDFKDEIKLHGEMYYQQDIPLMLWFFCAHPASQDGETILCDGRQFFNELSSPLKELFSKKKLKYVGHLNKDAWQKQYKTNDLKVVEQTCIRNNLLLQINDDKSIDLQYICPAIHPSRCGKYPTFISSLLPAKHRYKNTVFFEDNSEITDDIVSELNEVADRITTEISWQAGDILMVDNTRIMHGRRAFSDHQRDIYLRLCSPAFPF
ncbi:TauD/TfdA family dioxygenase [Microcoleus sp. w2-18bC1]|uniref:TauD/TfdA family dioxygenase n=1 Tax=unclassified Microcoleus TaxID=2642155 RepID=UPI002FD76E4F